MLQLLSLSVCHSGLAHDMTGPAALRSSTGHRDGWMDRMGGN